MRNVRFAQPGVWLQVGIENKGRLIGDIAVRVDGDEIRQATVGFTLAAEAQGHGYATGALRKVISLLFTEHDVHRIYADCDSRNDRSVALLERIGMRREAALHHKSAWWNTPKPADIWTRPRRPRTSSSRLTQNEPVAGTVSRPVCGS